MSNAEDDAAARGGPRKPRIEVLRGRPEVAPAASEPPLVFGGGGYEHTPVVSPAPVAASRQAEHAHPTAQRRGGLLSSPVVLLALLAVVVLIGAIWYASRQREPDVVFDVPADPVTPAATDRSAAPPAYDDDAAPDTAVRQAPSDAEAPPREPASEPTDAAFTPSPPRVEPAPPARDPAPAEDAAPSGGTSAVATVRAFYAALSAGDGGSAAQWVVPSKRRSGPLSAGALSRYYSSFRRPLRVRSIAPGNGNSVRVSYDYVLADGRLCRGAAAVDLVQSGGRSLVRSIRTAGPC